MSRTLFRTTRFDLDHLVKNINRGDVALPDTQRPFVWPNRKVRDLLDSMFKGFPVGYLLFWATGAEVGARAIGVDAKDETVPRWLIVDGQQRLTSLYSAFTGHPVVREDYTESRIRIAFRPQDARFEVTDAAIEKDPEYLADITPLWKDYKATVRTYLKRLEAARGTIDQNMRDEIDNQFDRVRDLRAYPFEVVELDAAMNEEHVAEVFVRINSEGITLNQADFILTLMSVFREKARKQLEEFARAAKKPSIGGASAFNWYIQPQPDQLLRVAVAVAFRRAVLKHAYSILRGKDLETGEFTPERRDEQFDRLQQAQDHLVNLLHWHEFLQCLERAGFRGSKMISGQNAILYSYALWLIGRVDYQVPLDQLKDVIARWFFMAHTTGRYSGSFETRFEADVARLSAPPAGDAHGFITTLEQVINDTMTADYWSIILPNQLATSAAKSPALLAYIAALNILDADILLSSSKVRSRLDPAITLKKGIERHHLFPKSYLKTALRITDTRSVNQIANFALVDWSDNIAISDLAPANYWPEQLAAKALTGHKLAQTIYWHALPEGWERMPFDEFLAARRKRMALVVRDAMNRLADPSYEPRYIDPAGAAAPEQGVDTELRALVDTDVLPSGTTIVADDGPTQIAAQVLPDGRLYANGETYDGLIELSEVLGLKGNPWFRWSAELADARVVLGVLREAHDTDVPT
ncbi:GmrSD restriction endonuclease domain-containing protein [Amycolatopsis minnesotensis]